MIICIDIDDVVINCAETIFNHPLVIKSLGVIPLKDKENYLHSLSHENLLDFFRQFNCLLVNCKYIPNAIEVINYLSEQGHKIYFCTARNYSLLNETIEVLKPFKYDKLYMNCEDKVDICKALNADIVIEDSVYNCNKLLKDNFKVICFAQPWNEQVNTIRCENWLDINKEICSI